MKKNIDLTQEYLKECLTYDPETGIFTWKERPVNHFKDGKKRKSQSICKNWNSKYANKEAGTLNNVEYRLIRVHGKLYVAQRLAWLYMEGYWPEHSVDHIDQNKNNNKWSNLRHVTQQCNMQNCKLSKNNKSGVNGVWWNKSKSRWVAEITINRKNKWISSHKNLDDAAMARYNEEQNDPDWVCSVESSAEKYLKEHKLI